MAQSRTVFAREATGLVKNLTFLDQFLMSMSMLAPTGFVFASLAAPYWFPGANLPLIFIIGCIPAFAIAVTYGIFSAALPRSGGDYVWTGRILGPRLAAMLAIMILVPGNLAYLAENFWLVDGFGLAQTFVSAGLVTGNQALVAIGASLVTPSIGFAVSLVFIAIVFVIAVFGIDAFRKTLRYVFVFYTFSAILYVVGISVAGVGYAPHFDAAMSSYNLTYSSVMSVVNSNPQLSTFNLGSTLLAVIPLGFLSYAGFNYNTYLAGETRDAASSIPRGLLLSVLIGLVCITGLAAISYASLGGAFIGGMSYLFNSGQLGNMPVQPSINFLVSLGVPPWLGILINIDTTVGFFIVCMSFTMAYSRIFFAMAFDRILPTKVAAVSDRFSSPYVSIIAVTALSVVFTAVWWFTGWGTSYLNGALAINIAYIIPGIAAMLFPVLKKDLYKQTVKTLPGWLGTEILGVPVLSLAGLVVTIVWVLGIYSLLNPGYSFTYLGSALPYAVIQTVTFMVLGVALYETARAYHRRKDGFDLAKLYSEVPPE
jgi:amino acid transporter